MKACKVCEQPVEDKQNVCNRCDEFTDKTNRSFGQTKFLLQLVGNDFEGLKQLEMQIKNCFVFYCPESQDEVQEVMNMEAKTNFFIL